MEIMFYFKTPRLSERMKLTGRRSPFSLPGDRLQPQIEDGSIIDEQGDRCSGKSKAVITAPQITVQPEQQAQPASGAAKLFGDFAPKLVQLTEDRFW